MLKKVETVVSSRQPLSRTFPQIEPFKSILDTIRHSGPEELKEEIYLHLISRHKGRFGNNTEVLQLLPVFNMYLKPPPLQIEKFLVVYLSDIPLLAINPNEPTTDNILLLKNEFVERDWLPNEKIYC